METQYSRTARLAHVSNILRVQTHSNPLTGADPLILMVKTYFSMNHAGQQEGNGCGLPSQNCHSSPLLSAIRPQSRAIVEPQWMRGTVMLSSGPQTLPISDVYYI